MTSVPDATIAPEPHPAPSSPLAVEMRGIVKRFPGVVANDGVDFDVRVGEVHALLGENGAGKSTLMNVLDGLYRPEAGEIRVFGRPVDLRSPRDAIAAGIGMVHQHFALVPTQTVTENILLGLDEPRFRMDLRRFDTRIAELAARHGLTVDPQARIWQLSVGEQQRVEILKMLYRGARILILDEPTAVLAPQEAQDLFRTLRAMVAEGTSVVFISHKLAEVAQIADRVTVMRRGKVTAAGIPAAGSTPASLAERMVGRDVVETIEKSPFSPGPVVLSVRAVDAVSDRGLPALRGVSLDVRAGEILGVAGVAGNGQSELAQVLTGLRRCTAGSIQVNGVEVANRNPREVIDQHIGHVPEDRTGVGTAPDLSIADNLIMKSYRDAPIARRFSIDAGAVRRFADRLRESYAIAAPSVQTEARLLSGGNLQRLILAREIASAPRLLVAVQPTRGLDVGAITAVHRLILEQREAGSATILLSEDLDEVLALSDRIAVIYEGRIAGLFDAAEASLAEIGLLMTGGRPARAMEPTDPTRLVP
jgi:general nucleoside transport system ATP-binding protein